MPVYNHLVPKEKRLFLADISKGGIVFSRYYDDVNGELPEC